MGYVIRLVKSNNVSPFLLLLNETLGEKQLVQDIMTRNHGIRTFHKSTDSAAGRIILDREREKSVYFSEDKSLPPAPPHMLEVQYNEHVPIAPKES